jgi:hypothetical protein
VQDREFEFKKKYFFFMCDWLMQVTLERGKAKGCWCS